MVTTTLGSSAGSTLRQDTRKFGDVNTKHGHWQVRTQVGDAGDASPPTRPKEVLI